MKDNRGGWVIPDNFRQEVEIHNRLRNPYRPESSEPLPPLTLRQRFRLWRMGLRERIHDWLFPDFRRDDDR